MASLVSINVGLPRNVSWNGQTIWTGIWKTSVAGQVAVCKLNVDGDGQGDLAGHGGEQRAVFVYQRAAYDYWAKELRRNDFVMGQFGENFTVDGLADDEVCVGDRYQIGDALFEVTQPRVTCYRVGVRMNNPQMPSLLVARGKPGFYLRVLKEGKVQAGDQIRLVAKGPEQMTVKQIDALLYLPGHDRGALERAKRIPALSIGWQKSFQALLQEGHAGGGNPALSSNIAGPAAWAGFREARIADIAHETRDVVALELEPTDGNPWPTAIPGQFVVVRLQLPSVAGAVLRSYSLCNAPNSIHYRLGIKREPLGIAGAYFADSVRAGDVVQMSAPRGSFVLQPGDEPVILLSAGIGVTPVLAMLHALAQQSSQQEVWWLYAARDGTEHPFAKEVRQLLGALPRGRSHIWYSRPTADDDIGRGYDSAGRMDATVFPELGIPLSGHYYLCGPPLWMESLRTQLSKSGVAGDHIHGELFGSRPATTPGVTTTTQRPPHQPLGEPGSGPSISFARSGLIVPWRDDFHNILELAEASDVPVQWSCRTGVCHTCETALISGELRYVIEPLESPVEGSALICCSVPKVDLALDL
jgi:ferredoxin-NADP reductase/MOSC domain-containing protein YiiM